MIITFFIGVIPILYFKYSEIGDIQKKRKYGVILLLVTISILLVGLVSLFNGNIIVPKSIRSSYYFERIVQKLTKVNNNSNFFI